MSDRWTTFYRVNVAGHRMVIQKRDGCTRTVTERQAQLELEAQRLVDEAERYLLTVEDEVKT